MNDIADIFVVGGGINGVGVARDAAGRGFKVVLAEKDDLTAHTSSSSSKLIHGGLRYLEHYEFRLVRESLTEREVLLQAAPHIIYPLRFILPHHKALRPAFILRIGLFLYDYIGGRKLLPASKSRRLRRHSSGQPLKHSFRKGFEYSDCWVDDARLVLLSAMDAQERGATILTRTLVTQAVRENGMWSIKTQSADGTTTTHKARAIVNAAGPWVDDVEGKASPEPKSRKQIRMVKGSHIIVPKLYEGPQAYTFQNADGRVVFAIPYETNYTLIGTTDVPYNDDPGHVEIDESEKAYLCELASSYFEQAVTVQDIVWHYAGVRPLVDDGAQSASKATRDYVLELDIQENTPMLSIYGGKITTYRCLAEDAVAHLIPIVSPNESKPCWTEETPLPGGEMGYEGFHKFQHATRALYPWLASSLCNRLSRAYGSRIHILLKDKNCLIDLGQYFGAGLYEAELEYMKNHEWAMCAEDALWRRSKLGLHMTAEERQAVQDWFEQN